MTMPALPLAEAFWMQGPFAPVTEELTVSDLVVEGELPTSLEGTFLRNGPNPSRGPSPHWWFGDGMIHGIRLEGGRASAYRNRYVRTARYTGQPVGPAGDDADAVRARRIRGGGTSNTTRTASESSASTVAHRMQPPSNRAKARSSSRISPGTNGMPSSCPCGCDNDAPASRPWLTMACV